jgi:hypothetical protein
VWNQSINDYSAQDKYFYYVILSNSLLNKDEYHLYIYKGQEDNSDNLLFSSYDSLDKLKKFAERFSLVFANEDMNILCSPFPALTGMGDAMINILKKELIK